MQSEGERTWWPWEWTVCLGNQSVQFNCRRWCGLQFDVSRTDSIQTWPSLLLWEDSSHIFLHSCCLTFLVPSGVLSEALPEWRRLARPRFNLLSPCKLDWTKERGETFSPPAIARLFATRTESGTNRWQIAGQSTQRYEFATLLFLPLPQQPRQEQPMAEHSPCSCFVLRFAGWACSWTASLPWCPPEDFRRCSRPSVFMVTRRRISHCPRAVYRCCRHCYSRCVSGDCTSVLSQSSAVLSRLVV